MSIVRLTAAVAEALRAGRPHELLTLAVAAWMRYLRGTDLTGRSIDVRDPRIAELQPLARAKSLTVAIEAVARDIDGRVRRVTKRHVLRR